MAGTAGVPPLELSALAASTSPTRVPRPASSLAKGSGSDCALAVSLPVKKSEAAGSFSEPVQKITASIASSEVPRQGEQRWTQPASGEQR